MTTTTPHGPTGTLTRTEGTNVITFVRDLPAPPDRVWRALTTADGLASWLAPSASIDARHGGDIRFTFDEENVVTGTITESEPETHLAHTWVINDEAESTVRYDLTPVDGGTRLTLVHTGLPDEMCGGYTPGWHAYLVRLDASTSGTEPPEWLEIFQAVADAYAAPTED